MDPFNQSRYNHKPPLGQVPKRGQPRRLIDMPFSSSSNSLHPPRNMNQNNRQQSKGSTSDTIMNYVSKLNSGIQKLQMGLFLYQAFNERKQNENDITNQNENI